MNKRLIKNEFFVKLLESFFGRGSFIIFTLLFSFVCTRLYGAEIFGQFTYAYTIITVLMFIAKAGLDQGLMYYMPKDGNKHISLSFLVNLITSLLIVCIMWVIIDTPYIKAMLPMIWLFSVERLFFGIYKAEGKIKEFYYINGPVAMILRILLALILFYVFDPNIYIIIISLYISFIVSNIFYYHRYKRYFGKIIFDSSYLMYSLTLVVGTMLGGLINKADVIMLGLMASDMSVGIYQITVQISNTASVLLIIFNTVFAPKISTLFHEQKFVEMKGLYIKATRILAVISLLTTMIILLGKDIFLGVFGEAFTQGDVSLTLRSIGQFINIAVGGVWVMLAMTGEPRFQMYANIAAFAINIALNFILIPEYGIDGAAFASMVTLVFTNVIGYLIVSRRFNVKVFKVI
ncbi:oligosaccharide flippase family protein [Salibacterium sp. K-3]